MSQISRKPVPVVTEHYDLNQGAKPAPPKTNPPIVPQPSLHQQWQDLRSTIIARLDRILPPHHHYLGVSRRIFLTIIFLTLLVLLALILGLSIGLTRPSTLVTLPLGSQQYTGDLTYYGPGLGACGKVSGDGDIVVSISHFVFDAVGKGGSDPNANGLCEKKVRAVREGRGVELMVVDRCVGCKPTDIDVSPGAFRKLADPDLGRVQVTWAWVPPVPTLPPS